MTCLVDVLTAIAPADAALARARTLQRRVDTKYVATMEDLKAAIEAVGGHYRILLAGEERIASYETLYFDTPDFSCATAHRRGRRPRYKVRVRHYLDRGLSVLETKKKVDSTTTFKTRREIDYHRSSLDSEDLEYLRAIVPFDPEELRPTVWTNFRRVTLVGAAIEERITIDIELTLRNPSDREQATLGGIAVLEVKGRRRNARAPMTLALRSRGVRPLSMSKYCAGVTLLHPNVRMSGFRARLKGIRKVAEQPTRRG